MTTAFLDQAKSQQFAEKMVGIINGAAMSLMTSIGHRTGLFDAMSRLPAATTHEIAAKAKLSERYVREWLGAMVTGGIVEHDPAAKTYWLPPEHAAWLTRAASPNNMAVSTQWVSVLGFVEDQVVAAFKHGKGVPYSAYNRFHEVMAEESAQTTVAGLFEHILPLVPGLVDKLRTGIDALDLGCGSGWGLMAMAEEFPRSRFTGYDFSEQAIESAREQARLRRLANVRFEALDVAEMKDAKAFDLVTAFDAIHDQAKPDVVLRNIRAALRPNGTFLMQDILAHSCHHQNVDNPLAPFIYTVSCMHCMSVSLANNGMGLGAAWGKETALRMLKEAGFHDVKVDKLPHDILNYYYVARP
jgi:2-polyprenyl-3-methyl-5-hydroxy-6-metoxy-1,4-benzoquinol methylase